MWSLDSIRQEIKVGHKAAATAAVALFRAPGNHRGPHRGDTYVPCLNFKTHRFVYWEGTYIPVVTIFAIFFVNVGHSFTHLCVFFHHFRCLRSLFQGHLACQSFTLTGLASSHDEHDISGATLRHFGTESTVCWDCGTLHLYIIPDSCSCILQVHYSRHIGTKSLPYPRLTTRMNQNLLCSSQVIKFPEVIPYNFQTKCFKTLTFEQHIPYLVHAYNQ